MKKILYSFLVFILLIWTKSYAYWLFDWDICKVNLIENASNIKFSINWSYAYTLKNDWKYVIIKDWKTIWKDYDTFTWAIWIPTIEFSSDWSSFTYLGFKNKIPILIKDWERIWDDGKFIISFSYSWDWNDLSYTYFNTSETDKKPKEYIYIKEKTFSGYNISNPVFSTDWKHYYFKYDEQSWWTNDRKSHVVKDWVDLWISKIPLLITNNDKKNINMDNFSYVKIINWKEYFVRNEVVSATWYDEINYIFYSGTWTNYSYEVKNNWKSFYIYNWKEIWKEYYSSKKIQFSPGLNNYIYIATKDDNSNYNYLIKDWEVLIEWENLLIWTFKFINNWASYYYLYTKEWKTHLVKDWAELWAEYEDLQLFVAPANLDKLIYAVKEKWKFFVIIDWIKSLNWYQSITDFNYSPDLTSFYFVGQDPWKSTLIKDNIEIWTWYVNIKNVRFSPDWKELFFKWWKETWDIYYFIKKEVELWTWSLQNNYNYSPSWKILYSHNVDKLWNISMIICKSKLHFFTDSLLFLKENWLIILWVCWALLVMFIIRIMYILNKYT